MIIVHEKWLCKPGSASKMAKMFKEGMSENKHFVNLLTDLTGPYNTVIMVSQYESLTDFEKSWEEEMKDTEKMKKMEAMMSGYHDMFISGSREIYKVW